MRIIGVGADVVQLERLRRLQASGDLEVWLSSFTLRELAGENRTHPQFVGRMGERFALKEAVYKAFGGARTQEIAWQEIETFTLPSGKLSMRLHHEAARLSEELKIEHWAVSSSRSRNYAVANAIASGAVS